jgi:hypothetical protein
VVVRAAVRAEWGDFVRPDAYGVWEEAGHRVEFFVEHDTGAETLAQVAAKLDGYCDVAEAEGAARPLLFWLAQPGREPALFRALEGTALPVATATARDGSPTDAVWLTVGEAASRRRLIELAERATESSR